MTVCYACNSFGVTQTTLEWLIEKPFLESLKQQLETTSNSKGRPCHQCGHRTQSTPIPSSPDRLENAKHFFKSWRHPHAKGCGEIQHCKTCSTSWFDSNAWLKLPIPWSEHEVNYNEHQYLKTQKARGDYSDDPLKAVAGFLFGIPHLENTPALLKNPRLTYAALFFAWVITSIGLRNPEILKLLTCSPDHFGHLGFWVSVLTCAWANDSWASWIEYGMIFIIFAPLVEQELKTADFLKLLIVSAVGGVLFQSVLLPYPILGFGSVVSGIVGFFCGRFRTAIIGSGSDRSAAPAALLVFIAFDFKTMLDTVVHQGQSPGLAFLGSALIGFLFHLSTPEGASTLAFKTQAQERLKKQTAVKNWNS